MISRIAIYFEFKSSIRNIRKSQFVIYAISIYNENSIKNQIKLSLIVCVFLLRDKYIEYVMQIKFLAYICFKIL